MRNLESHPNTKKNAGEEQTYVGKDHEKVHQEMAGLAKYVTSSCYFLLVLLFIGTMVVNLTRPISVVPIQPIVLVPGGVEIEILIPSSFRALAVLLLSFTWFLMISTMSLAYIYRHAFFIRNRTIGFNISILNNSLLFLTVITLTYMNNVESVFFSATERLVTISDRSRLLLAFLLLFTTFFALSLATCYVCRMKLFYDVFITPELFTHSPPTYGKWSYAYFLIAYLIFVLPPSIGSLFIYPRSLAWNVVFQVLGQFLLPSIYLVLAIFFAYKLKTVSSRFLNFWAIMRILILNFFVFAFIGGLGLANFNDPDLFILTGIYRFHVGLFAICIVCVDSFIDPLIRYFLVSRDFTPPPPYVKKASKRANPTNNSTSPASASAGSNTSTTNLL